MMAYGLEDRQTIYALATGPGKAAVAVVRISGRSASRILERMTGGLPSARRASFRHIHDPSSGEVLDEALSCKFTVAVRSP
jgi:tRNA modification GTPase